MEETDQKKKHPSLPPNYVSLVQLQERWIKEQQRKQKQKEEEERKRREIEEEQTPKHENSKNQNQYKNGLRAEISTISSTYRPFLKNRRNQSKKNHRSNEVNQSKSDDLIIKDAVVCDEVQKTDESEKKKKKKKDKWRKKRKPRVQENLIGGAVQVSSENVPGQEIPLVVTVRNEEKNDLIGECRNKGDYLGLNNEVQEQRVLGDQTMEIGRNFENLTLNGEKKSNMRSLTEINGPNWRYKGGSGRFGVRKMWKQRDGNFVWVKKGEISDPNVSEIRSSGSIMEAGEGKKKSAVVWKQKERNWRQ